MSNASTCLLTKVKNVSGGELPVSLWPPHGKVFAADEEATVYGDIVGALTRGNKPARCVPAFANLLIDDKLQIISSPNPILYDATVDRTSMLRADNDALFMSDPCWAETEFNSPV